MNKDISVIYFTNIPAPYTVEFFNELGKKVDLTVIFEDTSSSDREGSWYSNNFNTFKAFFYHKKNNSIFRIFSLFKYIGNQNQIVVIGNYSSFLGIRLINYMKLKKIKFAIRSDGSFIKHEPIIKKWFKKTLISKASLAFSPNTITDDYFKYYGLKQDNIVRYHFTSMHENAFISKLLTYQEKVIERSLYFKEKYIGIFVGSTISRKGIDSLVKITEKLKKTIGIYVIGGDCPPMLLEYIKNKSITNIHFLGFVDFETMLAKYLKFADFFVFPTRYDIWGLVINEALSMGIPVVTTDKCGAGLTLVKNDYNGYITPVDDIEEMVKAINKLVENHIEEEGFGQNCLDSIKSYSIENMAIVYYMALSKLANLKN